MPATVPPALVQQGELVTPARRDTAFTTAVAVVVAALLGTPFVASPVISLFVIQAALVGLIVALGLQIAGRPLGALIDTRNVISLSRLQLVLWTTLVLSAYATIALLRVKAGIADPLAVGIEWHLWALTGISLTSLVGTPLLLEPKRHQAPQQRLVEQAATARGEDPEDLDANRHGALFAHPTPLDARLADLFEGDEVGTSAYVDLAKVQMFLFTLVAAVAFEVDLVRIVFLSGGSVPSSLPVIPDGLVAVLGISHAGYLMSKAGGGPAAPRG